MPQDEHNEWPSFKTVLRDVATSDRSTRPETRTTTQDNADHRSDRGTRSPHRASASDIDVLDIEPAEGIVADADIEISKGNDKGIDKSNEKSSPDIDLFGSDLLPEPLAPLDIDTSAVRALLLPSGDSTVEEFDLRALDPLEPAPAESDPFEPVAAESLESVDTSPLASAEAVDLGESAFSADSPFDTDSSFESTSPFEPESVFDLAFDADALPEVDTTPNVFEDLDPMNGISLDDDPQFTDDVEPSTELPSAAVFELDESAISAAEASESTGGGFTQPPIDSFDLQTTSESIENERIAEFGEDLYGLALSDDEPSDDFTEFDSVATANAIEGELNELSDLSALEPDFSLNDEPSVDTFDLDNVVPIRPEPSPNDESADSANDLLNSNWLNPTDGAATPLSHAADGPPPARVAQTGWVGLEAVQPELEKVADDVADPWAHMRPTDEPKSEGFLAKIFGGDERRRARARRRAKEVSESEPNSYEADADVAFDSACPNCGGECQVDLDDPIGRRVHVSCPACDHMWFTPYIEPDAQTG